MNQFNNEFTIGPPQTSNMVEPSPTFVDSSTLKHAQHIALEDAMKVLSEGDEESVRHMLKKAGILPSIMNKDASPKRSALTSPSNTLRESPTDENVSILTRENEEVSRPVASSYELSTENSTSKSEEGSGPSTEHLTVIDSSTLSHGQHIALEEAMKVLSKGDKESAQRMLRIAGIALYEDEKDNKSGNGGGLPAPTAQSPANNATESL